MEEMIPCPHCGAEIRSDAKACPNCGSDDETGWSQKTYLDGIDLPDSDEYEELREREFGSQSHARGIKGYWKTATALAVAIVFLALTLRLGC